MLGGITEVICQFSQVCEWCYGCVLIPKNKEGGPYSQEMHSEVFSMSPRYFEMIQNKSDYAP